MKDDDLRLHSLHYENGELDMRLSGERGKLFVFSLVEFFRQNGGKNYLTLTVNDAKDKFAINIQNCTGTTTPAEKIAFLETLVNDYKNISIDLARIIQRLENEKIDLSVDDIKAVWNLKTMLGEVAPTSIEEGTGSLIIKED